MRVITFQDRFAGPVRTGAKTQTIRKRARCAEGDTLSLRRWTGLPYRSKQELLREAVCVSITPVVIDGDGVRLDGKCVSAEAMARADGFACWDEMREWFGKTHGLGFSGFLIKWQMLP